MANEEYFLMSKKELSRLDVLKRIEQEKGFTIGKASVYLSLSYRHVKRLLKRYREEGPSGLISKRRGKPSNRKTSNSIRLRVLKIIEEDYRGFSFTLISELLEEDHEIKVSRELVRQWLIEDDQHIPRSRKKARVHQPRDRRPRFGELIQIDGSSHHWFGKNNPRCTLIAFIDDATSNLLYMRFEKAETTLAYMQALKTYLLEYGVPLALYADRHSIFRKSSCERLKEERWSQFERAVNTLGIEMIHAKSPQAKGRIERAFGTLQDRLVKLMRLKGIGDIESGNIYLKNDYMSLHNQKFGIEPFDPSDAHMPLLLNRIKLDEILTVHYQRKVSKNLTVQFENQIFCLITKGSAYSLRGSKVSVIKNLTGGITILYKGKKMKYTVGHKTQIVYPPADKKSVHSRIAQAMFVREKPKPNHPWRNKAI